MATLNDVLTFSRAQAQTDSNGLTDTKGIIYANEALVDFHRKLVFHGIDASQIQESYADGIAGVGTYLYPTDMLFLKAIELNYNDTQPQNYIMATQCDVSNIAGQESFSQLRVNQPKQNPQFDDRGDCYEIFPTPGASDNVSQLIRIFYFLKPTEYTATSDAISYPESLDYRILGWRIAADFYYSLSKINESEMFNAKYEERVKELVSTLGRGSQQPLQATPISLTGWEF
jgi:hypothetical protein